MLSRPRPDLRRRLIPIGPVAVFGASNFPLAFSVPGGDTASAIAAGCPVVLKAHPSHPATSQLCFDVLSEAARKAGAPEGTLGIVYGQQAGADLVTHPATRAVGFTGSQGGARALLTIIEKRAEPIPFFGHRGLVRTRDRRPQRGSGNRVRRVRCRIGWVPGHSHTPHHDRRRPAARGHRGMLRPGCGDRPLHRRGRPLRRSRQAAALPHRHGPAWPGPGGRIIFDGYPTGVAVSWAQHHGGPWPATNSQHTSVGASAIRRFLRPMTWQNPPAELLPAELRDDYDSIPRRIDGRFQPVP